MTERMTRDSQIRDIDQLVRDVTWHIQKLVTHVLTDPTIDLTLPQLITLLAIDQSGTCRMTNLAELTQQSAGTLTGIVDRLIDDKLVERTRNAGDRRVVEVMLTPHGVQRLQGAIEASQISTNHLLSDFSDSELQYFGILLQRLLGAAQSSTQTNGYISSPDAK